MKHKLANQLEPVMYELLACHWVSHLGHLKKTIVVVILVKVLVCTLMKNDVLKLG